MAFSEQETLNENETQNVITNSVFKKKKELTKAQWHKAKEETTQVKSCMITGLKW